MALIILRHNIEVAHRLFELPGKCENIHGHSMWVDVSLHGGVNSKGILEVDDGPLEFGAVKKKVRGYLDENYDHKLLLNQADPWAEPLADGNEEYKPLPGLAVQQGDPTTENLAMWFSETFANMFKTDCTVKVQETSVNAAEVYWPYNEKEQSDGSS